MKSQQSKMSRILNRKYIKCQLVDASQDNTLWDEMSVLMGNPKSIPSQIVNGDQYCGDYELFTEAMEQNMLQEFLEMAWTKPKPAHWTLSPHSPAMTSHEEPCYS